MCRYVLIRSTVSFLSGVSADPRCLSIAWPAVVWLPPLAADGGSYSGAPDISKACVCVYVHTHGNRKRDLRNSKVINSDVIGGHMPFFFLKQQEDDYL